MLATLTMPTMLAILTTEGDSQPGGSLAMLATFTIFAILTTEGDSQSEDRAASVLTIPAVLALPTMLYSCYPERTCYTYKTGRAHHAEPNMAGSQYGR